MESVLLNNTGSNSNNLKLEGISNWSTWKFQLRVMLKALEVYTTVDGSLPKPEEASEIDKWNKKDAKAQSVIVTRLSEKVMLQVMTCESAKAIWDKLHTIYEQTSETSLHLLQQKFFAMQYKENEDIATFLAKIEENVCQIKQLKGEVPEKMVLTKILTALPEKYKHFVSAWESVPSDKQELSELTARLLIEEQRVNYRQEEVTALIAQQNRNCLKCDALVAQENIRKCFTCNKVGHLKKDCYRDKYCENCKKRGHLRKNCWFLNKEGQNSTQGPSNAFTAISTAFYGKSVIQDWIVDSGASEHMCHDKHSFFKYDELLQCKNIVIGDGTIIEAVGIGNIKLQAFNGQKWIETILNNVLHVPKMTANLFSVSAATNRGYNINMNYEQCKFLKNDIVCAIAKRYNKIYKMVVKCDDEIIYANVGSTCDKLTEWHRKMVHQNIDQIKNILKRSNINFENGENSMCIPCIKGKQHKQSFELSESKTEKPGQLIHMDVCGPMETSSLGGAKYFLLIKDDFSGFRSIFFLKHKFEVENKIHEFVMRTQVNPGHVIQIMRSDNGTEFVNNKVRKIMIDNGIQHQTTVVYTPQQNGRAEREMRTIVEAARTMILENNFNKNLWAEAVNTAVYVLNRTGRSRIRGKTPFEIWFNTDLFNIEKLKIFGSEVAVHIPDEKRKKWDPKSELGIFVGYGQDTKGYRIYYPNKHTVEIRKDVIFINNNVQKQKTSILQENNVTLTEEYPENEPMVEEEENEISEQWTNDTEVNQEEMDHINELRNNENIEIINETENIRNRNRRQPKWLDDFETNLLCINNEPSTYQEAMEAQDKENWLEAIEKETQTLTENNTWTEVTEVPVDAQIVSSKWVFKIKENLNGEKQFKARLVARGFEQVDCDPEIYAPVARLTTFRLFMVMANKMRLPVHQLDITGAFLYGDIKETIYMKLPCGTYCKLNHSIYGLKKSPMYWNEKFDSFMITENFIRSKNDLCLYSYHKDNNMLYLLIYVDDLLIFGSKIDDVENFKVKLNNNFKTKYLGLASNYLGISIKQDVIKGITIINQKKYLENVLKKFNMSDCKGVDTPMEHNFNFECLNIKESESKQIEKQCRQLIGSLLYAVSGTRPDLCVSVIFLSRYQHCASINLYKYLKRILRYVKSTLDLSLIYDCNSDSELKGFVDADWASDTRDRKSTSGYILTYYDCIISWYSKKQMTVALSSCEAEYIALSFAITEALWIKKLILDFKLNCNHPILLYEDNQSVIKITQKNENNKRLKHVDVKYNYILDSINEGFVELRYIQTSDNVADLFTKPLNKILFQKFRNCILK